MHVYTYQAALWCEPCGEELIRKLECPGDPDDPYSYDSDAYPKGPEPASEADNPYHCEGCGEFLENPLTPTGLDYVKRRVRENPESNIVQKWAEYYCVEIPTFAKHIFPRDFSLDGAYICPECGGDFAINLDHEYEDRLGAISVCCPYCRETLTIEIDADPPKKEVGEYITMPVMLRRDLWAEIPPALQTKIHHVQSMEDGEDLDLVKWANDLKEIRKVITNLLDAHDINY